MKYQPVNNPSLDAIAHGPGTRKTGFPTAKAVPLPVWPPSLPVVEQPGLLLEQRLLGLLTVKVFPDTLETENRPLTVKVVGVVPTCTVMSASPVITTTDPTWRLVGVIGE